MQMAVKNFLVVLLVCLFSLAQSEECLQSQISVRNIKKSDLKERYDEGATVRLSCSTGYVGFVRIDCEKGRWKYKGGQCKKKSCGHPGDTPNGSFRIIGESEFVFGATVEYTCNTGYIMASRENHRNCRTQGWDNAVPVCEVVKCPTITTSEDVITSGNTEEASFDDVIHFECRSPQKKLDGEEYIHCTKDGSWSAPVPKCIEIRCFPSPIINGKITSWKVEYLENELLTYTCSERYRPIEGRPKCTKNGWSIKPECEEIICLLGFSLYGVKSTSPVGINIFRPREILTITCLKNYSVVGTKKESLMIQCKDNGEWQRTPTCAEITCDIPRDTNLYYTHFYFDGDRKLEVQKIYKCKRGYFETASHATCTINGWIPRPLCEQITCPKPVIENATVLKIQDTYAIRDRIEIKCLPGYEPDKYYIRCNDQGKWENMKRCTLPEGACGEIKLTHGSIHYFKEREYQFASYSCDEGYKEFGGELWGVITCQKGVWSYTPQCIREDECGSLPTVNNGNQIPINKPYKNGDSLQFHCDFGYTPRPSSIVCEKGQWQKPVCQRDKCGIPPEVENGVIISYIRDQDGEQSVKYACRVAFELKGPDTIGCLNSKWENKPTCVESPSIIPSTFPMNETINGTKLLDQGNITVTYNGKNQTNSNDQEQTHDCSSPSLPIPSKKDYEDGEIIHYTCPSQLKKNLTCSQGIWKGEEPCMKACNKQMNKQNRHKMHAAHEEFITFKCHEKIQYGSVTFHQQCKDGEILMSVCTF